MRLARVGGVEGLGVRVEERLPLRLAGEHLERRPQPGAAHPLQDRRPPGHPPGRGRAGRWSPRRPARSRGRPGQLQVGRGLPDRRREPAGAASSAARGWRSATSRMSAWEGASKLPGTCRANQPPGARASTQRASSSRCPGTHWSVALVTMTSAGGRGRLGSHSRRSAATHSTRPSVVVRAGCARASDSEESTPTTRASGQRSARLQRQRAVAAPEVDDQGGSDRRDASHQVGERPVPVGAEDLVLPGIPRRSRLLGRPDDAVLMSRYLTPVRIGKVERATGRPPGTRSTGSSRPGDANVPTSTSPRCRCSPASPGWRAGSTWLAAPPSPSAAWSAGSSTCCPRCAGAGPPYQLSPGQLMRQTLVTSGTMTNRVDRLDRVAASSSAARPHRPAGRHRRASPTPAGTTVDAALADLLVAGARPARRAAPADRDDARRRCCARCWPLRRLTARHRGRAVRSTPRRPGQPAVSAA